MNALVWRVVAPPGRWPMIRRQVAGLRRLLLARAEDLRHTLADLSGAAAVLGFAPRVSFCEGLATTVEWRRITSGSNA